MEKQIWKLDDKEIEIPVLSEEEIKSENESEEDLSNTQELNILEDDVNE